MRVGLIGNMNNNHFVLARYLRDEGIDAHLVLASNEFSHFHPSADSFDSDYLDFTREVTWGSQIDLRTVDPNLIRQDLSEFDILIGCGFSPGFCQKSGRSLDVFVPYGSDLYEATRYSKMPHRFIRHFKSVSLQRKGIANSKVISMPLCSSLYESALDQFASASQRWRNSIPLVYGPAYSKEKLDQNALSSQWKTHFDELRSESDFLVFMSGRHVWKCSTKNPNHKGNDLFIRGWSEFGSRNPSAHIRLVMFEYGPDFRHTKDLAKQLNIDHTISWIPVVPRKEIMMGLKCADLACGDFTHSWIAGGVTFEALSLGVPILKYRNAALHPELQEDLYPIINAATPSAIAGGLDWAFSCPGDLKKMGLQGRQWYDDAIVAPALEQFTNYISQC